MTSSTLHLDRSQNHDSLLWFASSNGVRFAIRRISLGRRIELARKIRDVGRYLAAVEEMALAILA